MIVRPSIINAAFQEPFPGWTDALTASSPLIILYCMGIARYIGNPTPVRCDLIPVDIVSNMIIVATVYQAK